MSCDVVYKDLFYDEANWPEGCHVRDWGLSCSNIVTNSLQHDVCYRCHGNHAGGSRPMYIFLKAISAQLNGETVCQKYFIFHVFWLSYANVRQGSGFFETQCTHTFDRMGVECVGREVKLGVPQRTLVLLSCWTLTIQQVSTRIHWQLAPASTLQGSSLTRCSLRNHYTSLSISRPDITITVRGREATDPKLPSSHLKQNNLTNCLTSFATNHV